MIHLRQLGPAFMRHAEAYGQLASAALQENGTRLRSRAALVASGLVLAVAFVEMAGGTALAAGWDSPYRWWVAAAVLGAIGFAAALCLTRATAALPGSPHLQALREEWQKDKHWLGRDRAARTGEPGTSMTLQGSARGSTAVAAPVGAHNWT
jgi:uncharacterized membrane protein YqjE